MVEKASKIMLTLFLTSILSIAFNATVTSANSGNIMIAMYGSTPTIDGSIKDSEWSDASTVTLSVTGGVNCTVYAKQDGINLYVGFNIPDVTYNSTDCCVIIFDVNHDGNVSLQIDDMWLTVSRIGTKREYNVTASGWFPTTVSGWAAQASSASGAWQCEYNITYFKVDVTAGTNKTLGVMFLIIDKDVEMGWYAWPLTASILKPVTWGDITITKQAEPFPTWVVAIIVVIAGLGVAILVYFSRVKRTTIKAKKMEKMPIMQHHQSADS